MRHHLHVELADTPSSLLRLLSCLHARHLVVERLHCERGSVCVEARGSSAAHRVQNAVERLIDVTSVRVHRLDHELAGFGETAYDPAAREGWQDRFPDGDPPAMCGSWVGQPQRLDVTR